MAERDVLESAADIFAFRHGEIGPQQQHRNDARLNRLAVDFVLDELREHARALRVSDEHDAAAVVVMLEIVIPCIEDIVVGQGAIHGNGRAEQRGTKRTESDLAVDGRVGPTLRSEAGELHAHNAFFFRAGEHVAVASGIHGDSGIDVEAIDLRIGVGGPGFQSHLAVGGDDGGGEVNVAGVLASGTAEPVVTVAVIVFCNGRGSWSCGRRGGCLGEGRASAGAEQN